MPQPTGGRRDGPFVVFDGWDMPIHDIAYYPKYANQIDNLKNVALSSPGALITAFNTQGWMKSCPAHDFSMWQQNPNINLYVRVDYPGWHFLQGIDSVGNDMEQDQLGSNVAAMMVNTIINFPEDKAAQVAGFNTLGYVKTKISTLSHLSDFLLDGLYIRIDFPGYEFFQGVDSPGGDIVHRAELADNVPLLIGASNALNNSLGFNTEGYMKQTMTVPPTSQNPSYQGVPYKGTYVRLEWSGYAFLPLMDSVGNDKTHLTGKRIWELVEAANADDSIIAFNTDGYMKTDLTDTITEMPDNQDYLFWGLYVKEPSLDSFGNANALIGVREVRQALYILRGTVNVWGYWFLSSAEVRIGYNNAVTTAANDIMKAVTDGTITAEEGARQAISLRNFYLDDARSKLPKIGRIASQALKPEGLPYTAIMDKYANKRFSKSYADLTQVQAEQVAWDAIEASGRANKKITVALQGARYLSKGVLIIGAIISVYQVVTADDWKFEIGRQVATWSGAIIGGELGVGVGSVVGPIGAIVGGLIGAVIGGIVGDEMAQLAKWFIGGTSFLSATEILGPTLLAAATTAVQDQLAQSGANFHVHQVLPTHLSQPNGDPEAIARDMVATKSEMRSDVEVVATLVWLVEEEGAVPLPAFGGNPRDLMALMSWAVNHVPGN